MSKSVYLLIFILILLCFQKVNGQNISNEGTEFWAVFPTHNPAGANNLANITIYVTSKENSEVTVSCGTYTSGSKAIPANTSVPFDVPRSQAYIDETESYPTRTIISESVLSRGIHVKVTDGQPKVAAYAHIYAGRRSAASLLLPVEAAGQKYYSMNFTQSPNEGNNFIVIVAAEDDTDVRIHNGNTIIPIHLNLKGDVFEYRSVDATDLTGTFIDVDPISSGCKKFVAFSGSSADNIGDCVLAPNVTVSRDPLFQQLYPVNSWGKNYGIVPFIDRRHIVRVLAQEDNTTVKADGVLVATLNAGMYYTSPISSVSSLVTADKNISVAQYSLSQACSGVNGGAKTGDPEMILLNPVEFNIKKITLFSSKDEAISEKYINIYMKTSGTSTFKIDGAAPIKSWVPVPSNPEFSYIQIGLDIELTSVTLMADVGFNAVAYGFGNVESYGYSAGTNLASNNYLLVTNESKTLESPDACVDEPASFKVVLPYEVSKITWSLNEGIPYVDAAPVATPITVNGEVYYSYFYLANKEFELADLGENEMKVNINLAATMAGCPGAPLELTFKFNVDALPDPDFDFAPGTNICPDVPVQFFDRSNSNTVGKKIARWTWTFDDGKIETTQNPFHTFTSGGEHSVKLSVATETGCMSDVKDIPVNVRPKMTAKFSAPSVVCPSVEFSITDQSSIETPGKIVKWLWNFGDGKPTINKFDALPFTYSYSEAGSYTITLVTESESDGCQSFPEPKVVTVASLPNVNFEIPTVCQAEVAVFKNTSTNELGTETGLQYFWDFGDASNPAMNTSQLKVGAHLYPGPTDYDVTLTVINASGCKNSKTQRISVNGATPVPIFSVANMDKLCSNKEVLVTSTSYVLQGGNLTKLEWQPDFVNHPEWVVTDDSPTSGESYSFDYKAFNTPEAKTYKIRLVAYSGGTALSCHEDKTQDITVLAAPILKFDDIDPICVNAESIPLTQAAETANLPGTGVYSGPGVVQVGANAFKFNPAVAGVNESGHTITYTFTANNGCPETIVNKIKVMPKPSLFVDRDVYVLAGGQKMILSEATGFKISYQWSPVTGLSSSTISNPIVTPEKDTEYTVTVTSGSNCIVYQTVSVHVLNSVNAPNTFSPNGDGVNDTWNIAHLDSYPNVTVDIFDRYGAKVFFSKGYSVPFDGNFKNEALPVGTYYYIIDPKNGRSRVTGSLTLIR